MPYPGILRACKAVPRSPVNLSLARMSACRTRPTVHGLADPQFAVHLPGCLPIDSNACLPKPYERTPKLNLCVEVESWVVSCSCTWEAGHVPRRPWSHPYNRSHDALPPCCGLHMSQPQAPIPAIKSVRALADATKHAAWQNGAPQHRQAQHPKPKHHIQQHSRSTRTQAALFARAAAARCHT
jgi:hypothetical protein